MPTQTISQWKHGFNPQTKWGGETATVGNTAKRIGKQPVVQTCLHFIDVYIYIWCLRRDQQHWYIWILCSHSFCWVPCHLSCCFCCVAMGQNHHPVRQVAVDWFLNLNPTRDPKKGTQRRGLEFSTRLELQSAHGIVVPRVLEFAVAVPCTCDRL